MTLTKLRYIAAVARERHFGRAAKACFVSQPTLSVAVRKLEDELGVKLLERTAAEVSVTPAGEKIVGQALSIFGHSSVHNPGTLQSCREGQRESGDQA